MNGVNLPALVLQSLRDPRGAIRAILALKPPPGVGAMLLALVAVGSSLLLHAGFVTGLMPAPVDPMMGGLFASPLTTALIQLAALCVAVALSHSVGRMFGGTGRLEDVILMIGWLQVVMLVLQLAQIAAALVLPPLVGVLGILGGIAFFWMLTMFLAEVHGFARPALVFLGILGTAFALAFVLSLVMAAFLGLEGV